MTASSKNKRLDAVEIALTPKEWGIRLADQQRSYPSEIDYVKSLAKLTYQAVVRPYQALREQAEQRHPGSKPEDIRARQKLSQALRTEYLVLRLLIGGVHKTLWIQTEVAGLKAALKLARLETIVLQDAFGRTARKAAEWVQGYKTADAGEEESRQGMLGELAAYTDLDYGEKWADSVPLAGGVRFRLPSVIEDWIAEVVAIAATVFANRAAVRIIQDKYFDGHPILSRNVEADLNDTIKILEDGIATFNAYLKTRAELFKAEWDINEEEDDGIAGAIPGEREGRLTIDIAAIRARAEKIEAKSIAAEWVKEAKDDAKEKILEETGEDGEFFMERLREHYGVKP